MLHEGKVTKGVLQTPQWSSSLKMLIVLLEDGGKDGKDMAKKELAKMAEAADNWNNYMDSKKEARNEAEAMTIIINIQTIQEKVHGKRFEYEDFEANSIDELRLLQDIMVAEWNAHLKDKK